jgi:hypothetical protein
MTTPIGKYRAKACGFDIGESQSGNPFVAVSFEIGGTVEPWTGYLTDKAAERTIQSLRLMGWQGDDLEKLTLADLPGWVQVDVREDKDKEGSIKIGDDGKPQTRIAFVNSLSGMFGAPMDHEARKALSLRLRGAVAKSPKVAPTLVEPEQIKPKPSREPGDDGDPPDWL